MVKFEDLKAQPLAVLTDMFAFLLEVTVEELKALPFYQRIVNYVKQGLGTTYLPRVGCSFYSKTHYNEEQCNFVATTTAKWLARFGYLAPL